MTIDEALKKWDVDEVKYVNELNPHLARVGAQYTKNGTKSTVFALEGQVSEQTTFIEFDFKDFRLLKDAIGKCRVVKDDYEIGLIRRANEISAGAHHAAMKRVSTACNETELEAVFLESCVAQGAKKQAYHSIVASGRAAATLHYVRNDQSLFGKLNVLLDAGAEWNCYCSDVVGDFYHQTAPQWQRH